MSFLEQQYLDFENVLSYRTRVDINRLDAILEFAEENIDALGLRATGNTLFTVFEKVKDNNKCILGIEILIPVDKAFESNEQYVYKPEFRLVNAVSARFCCPYSDIDSANASLIEYLDTNNLKAISSIYYMNSKNNPLSNVFDAYVSVSGNLL